MTRKNIINTVQDNLCIACGICAGSCPKKCIYMKIQDGITVPRINELDCNNCGICFDICPGQPFDYRNNISEKDDLWMGTFKKILKAQTMDDTLLKQTTSGGIITSLVKILLINGDYDCAFLVNTYSHKEITKTKKITNKDSFNNTTKSRYVTVSHEDSIEYILKNKEKKVILVGTSCFTQGLLNVIKKFHLNRNNYFIIGLFCDKTMTNNVYLYFEQHPISKNKLKFIYFREKEVGNWPGGIRIFLQDGSYKDIPSIERTIVKEYFEPERCLYCLDKLNIFSDISVGDNYIPRNADKKGISSIVIRTQQAMDIWTKYCDLFFYSEDDKKEFIKSQKIEERKINLIYSILKPIKYKLPSKVIIPEINKDIIKQYENSLRKIELGKKTVSYNKIQADIFLQNNFVKKGVLNTIKFIYKAIYAAIAYKSFEYIKIIFKTGNNN